LWTGLSMHTQLSLDQVKGSPAPHWAGAGKDPIIYIIYIFIFLQEIIFSTILNSWSHSQKDNSLPLFLFNYMELCSIQLVLFDFLRQL
jgi:hypothetical protein